ncbi:C2 domain-containing protein 5-like isoform X1 [Diaphorina citri]|uniref:C2 domain-containing protein 5-like isoform X1 n=1 Tax=Diaphorina citri TaxID=121845 RepID=A0A1S3DMH0_DIACI|nr:C2 domain-containing protein 5-like isoform X2 [Diaphorina citri]XP_026687944.1 C2 domain-containing protein 5-like isoform X1 [Diaphorina citri]
MFKENLDMLEYPFLTMSKYPPGFILRVGGTVRANSVKLLERMTNLEEPESRDAWWTELRLEVRSHSRALACNVVLGYSEHTAIW